MNRNIAKSNNYIETIKEEKQFPFTTFAEQVLMICEKAEIKTGNQFAFCTFLDRALYYKFKRDRYYVPEERIAYTICFGLKLSFAETCFLLNLGGLSIIPHTPYDRYRELLVEMLVKGNTYIPSCNEELKKLGFQELGTRKVNK